MAVKPTSVPTKRLQASISATATSFQLSDILGWDGIALAAASFGSPAFCVFRNANNTQVEFMEFDPATIASSSITISKRGLNYTGDITTQSTARQYAWTKGTYVELGTHIPQLFQWLKEYIDTAAVSGAVPATTSVNGLTRMSVDPASATAPIAVGDNDPRIPTTNQALFITAVVGMVIPYAGTSAPSGFLLCDGTAVSRTTYSALFAIISTNYGVGDGSTTFNLPDLRGRSIIGSGTGTKIATFASRATDTITVTGLSNTSDNEFQTGQAVVYSAPSGAIAGLADATTYYIIRISGSSFKLATTLTNAQNGTAISLSSDGTGAQTFTKTFTARTAGMTGGEEAHAMSLTELLSHTHTQGTLYSSNSGSGVNSPNVAWVDLSATAKSLPAIAAVGGNVAMNNLHPFGVLAFIIKY